MKQSILLIIALGINSCSRSPHYYRNIDNELQLQTIILLIIFIAIGILLMIFLYKRFEKHHSRYDEQYQRGFCDKCLSETLPDSCENLSSYYFFGTTFAHIGERCDDCKSIIVEHRKVIFGITTKSYDKYRAITVGKKITLSPMHRERQFISRKLKENKNTN